MTPIPENESDRLKALASYQILDTAPERAFDDITGLASFVCGSPIALVSLVDHDRQWFKSRVGLQATQTHRDLAFCAYTIMGNGVLEVEDATKDERFAENPLVTSDPRIRFYAGAPLTTPSGHNLGSLCVIDRQPRKLSAEQNRALEALARLAVDELELRNICREMERTIAPLKTIRHRVPVCNYCKNVKNESGTWQTMDSFLQDHLRAPLSYGICPACTQREFPELTAAPPRPGV